MKKAWHVLIQIGPDPMRVEDFEVKAETAVKAVKQAWIELTYDCVPNWDKETPFTAKDCRVIGVFPDSALRLT